MYYSQAVVARQQATEEHIRRLEEDIDSILYDIRWPSPGMSADERAALPERYASAVREHGAASRRLSALYAPPSH